MELDFSQIAIEVNHHGYIPVTHLSMQKQVLIRECIQLFNPIIAVEDIPCMQTWCFLGTIFCPHHNKADVCCDNDKLYIKFHY